MLDRHIGDVMKTLTDLKVADNTMVVFTTDNGPDRGAFAFINKKNHLRLGTMRGMKGSVYEGGHRVPFLYWWPSGIHQARVQNYPFLRAVFSSNFFRAVFSCTFIV